MSERAEEKGVRSAESKLASVIREVKNAFADRDDVVVDIREAQRTRLELLAEDLAPVFKDVPADDDRFDFAISAGAQPRLWIDSVAHVTMGRDRRTYRFLRDTRLGRVVLAESSDIGPVAEQVTRYIAERIVERRRILDGELVATAAQAPVAGPGVGVREPGRGSAVLRGIGMVLLGGLVGVVVIVLLAWERLAQLLPPL